LQRSRDQLPLHFTLGTLTTSTRLERPTSGGAVFNLQGEVVGLISIQSELAAIGSLVAINVGPPLNRVVEVLRTGQEVEYGYLGVETVNVTDGEAAVLGFDRAGGVRIVEEPLPGTPAARAGLRRNELILSVDGEWIKNSDELYLRVTLAFAGTSVELETLRDRQRRRVRVKELAKATPLGKPIITNRPASFRGARIDYLTVLLGEITPDQRELQQSLLTGLRQGGVLVREIESGSPADKAGLRLRDIITHVNNLPINGPKEFQRQIAQLTGPIALTLLPLDGQGPPRKLLIP
jgi:serine protease Do